MGPRAGQKVFTLQTVPAQGEGEGRNGAAQSGGFSLHAGLDIQCGQRAKLERLCRYVSRPPVAVERLALSASGQVRYALKTPTVMARRTSCWSHWISWRGWPRWCRRRGCT